MSDHNLLTRRDLLRLGAGAAVGLAAGRTALGARAAEARRPNVLYVFSDMQRATTLGCYGDPNAHTPVLDAFAREGARLDAAMSTTPVCCPHRACLMTGQYAHHHGVMSNNVSFNPKVKCVAETFKDAGYETGYAGKWHLNAGNGGAGFGFPPVAERASARKADGHYVTVNGQRVYEPTFYADDAIRFIERHGKDEKPWMFFLSWIPPHSPYAAPPEFRAHYQGKLTLPPNVPAGQPEAMARRALPDYYGMVESLDVEFGRVLQALAKAGCADDTIVVYSSDHGDMVGCQGLQAKRWPYEESARVPFLIRYPRAIKPGTVIADPMGTPDVYPTLAGLSGVKSPAGLDGVDFSDLLAGRSTRPPRDHVYLEMAYAYVPWPGWRALRTRQYSYARTVAGPWLLHDLEKDPCQQKNLVDDPASKALAGEMEQRLNAVMKESGDSWELRAADGDLDLWLPGGPKQQSQNLGVHWPGWAPPAEAGPAGKAGARKNGAGARKAGGRAGKRQGQTGAEKQ